MFPYWGVQMQTPNTAKKGRQAFLGKPTSGEKWQMWEDKEERTPWVNRVP